MKTLKTVPGQNLVLGHRGENLATRIIFSIAPWVETYGPGTAHLLHQRQGDSEPYPVATLQEGTEVSWDVTDGDTALEGYGKYELRYYVAETLVKSSVGETYTMKALQYGAEPPDPIQGWVDHVLEKENEIYEAASETKGYSEAAERAAGDALNFANAADQSAGNARLSAKTAADQAGQAAGSAKEAKEAAEEARKIVDGADVVKSVNGQGPDENGNVQIEVGTGSGVDVTAKPGQLIRVKSVDENGKPTAWEAVPWGYTEGGMVEIPVAGEWNEIDEGQFAFVGASIGLEVGKTYIVNWDGTDYEVTGKDLSVISGGQMPGVFLGNTVTMGGEDTGEPFMAIDSPSYTASQFMGIDFSVNHTFTIYHNAETIHPIPGKFLPDGVPYVEDLGVMEILPETKVVTDGGMAMLENAISGVTAGEKYIVKYNGIEYETVAVEQTADGATLIGLGNIGVLMGNAGTGEPFAIAISPDGAMIVAIDGATELTISIKGKATIIQKLDKRCLPNDSGFAKMFTVNVDGKIGERTSDKTFSVIISAINDGNTIVKMLLSESNTVRIVLHLARYTTSSVLFSGEYMFSDSIQNFTTIRIDDDNSVHEYTKQVDSGGTT